MNLKPWHTFAFFGVALILACVGVGWLSQAVIERDAEQTRAQAKAFHEENVRLALWRLDSEVAPLIAAESSRPHASYEGAFFPAGIRVADDLLDEVEYAQLYFRLGEDGVVESPQASETLARISHRDADRRRFARALRAFRKSVNRDQLIAALPREDSRVPSVGLAMNKRVIKTKIPPRRTNPAKQARPKEQKAEQVVIAQNTAEPQVQESQYSQGNRYSQQAYTPQVQRAKNSQELVSRDNFTRKISNVWSRNRGGSSSMSGSSSPPQAPIAPQPPQPPRARKAPRSRVKTTIQMRPVARPLPPQDATLMTPVWIEEALLLVRRDPSGTFEGLWLDWPVIRAHLLAQVADLVPTGELVAASAGDAGSDARLLASLPVRLTTNFQPPSDLPISPAVKQVLVVAWAGVGLAMFALFVLLMGAVALSERRAAFVSAVTHELRTPLTTFRMYTEMLSQGMVPEPKKAQYINTLRQEAIRQGHLVENVLSYARIERGRARAQMETLPVNRLLNQLEDRLADRASQAEMSLQMVPSDAPAPSVHVDVSAVEQILFNLVDNACKYAAAGEAKSIEISHRLRRGKVEIIVRDFGPGVARKDRKALFEPFNKSAHEAAESAPGVGLGLALCLRLARAMKGDLRYGPEFDRGASFRLILPVTR